MALDGIILSKVKEDLDKSLPIKINKINGTSDTEVIFNVLANKNRTSLVISLHSVYNHIALSNESYSDYEEPSTFIMVLRKHLLNGIITNIIQNDYDRYLLLEIRALNELYDEKEYILSVELMGKYANLILVDKETNKIIDALKKIPPFQNTKRTILQGAVFTLPEKQNKLDPFNVSENEINFDESLVKQLQGFSKQLELELRQRLETQSYKEIIEEIKESDSLYISSNNEYHVIPLTYLNLEYQKKDIKEGFDTLYYKSNEVERIKKVTEDIFKFIKRQIKHYDNKLVKLRQSLEDGKTLNEDRENGELLYTYSNLEKKGLKEISIEDYYGETRVIKLDPKLTIKANANKYYNTYSKKRKGKVYIEEQIEIASRELEYFTALKEQLDIASYNDALEIKDELIRYGYLKKKTSKLKKNKKISLYQVKVGDNTITFGKNNTQNDYLTFTFAKSNNMWFHALDYHGAHLVVDTDKPSEEVLRACANLAAYFSKGRYSSSVPVSYCLVKDVKKVKGAKAGFVTMRNYKTIYIDPELSSDIKIKAI
ncbi:MAG: NFACT RNA binding domain-containing protein [Erysipelotrichaceae bacterium]|nr:NFACT RNA binding domain-containing protein [Erysipelotrichaceae bacterium]